MSSVFTTLDKTNFLCRTLSDVAKSVMIYFNDATSPYRVLAIDLCSRGFEIWQQYFDSMEALRSLVTWEMPVVSDSG